MLHSFATWDNIYNFKRIAPLLSDKALTALTKTFISMQDLYASCRRTGHTISMRTSVISGQYEATIRKKNQINFMYKPIISVITPCYNGSEFIAECIESVIAQTFEYWEMLIDDCSTDNSAEIIKKYQKQDSRIKYLCTEKSSGSPAVPRNIGIDFARGEFLAFLDCDDLWLSNKLEQQFLFASLHDYPFVYSDYEKISHDGSRNGRILSMPAKVNYWDTLESCSIPCLTVLIKRSFIDNVRFRNTPKEDFVFWLEVLRRNGCYAYNTGSGNIVNALYRVVRNSRSANKFLVISQQWFVLRKIESVKLVPAIYFMTTYILKGFRKFCI